MNQDPIGLAGGVNKNIYVKNPNKGIDPLGLMEELSGGFNRSTQHTHQTFQQVF